LPPAAPRSSISFWRTQALHERDLHEKLRSQLQLADDMKRNTMKCDKLDAALINTLKELGNLQAKVAELAAMPFAQDVASLPRQACLSESGAAVAPRAAPD